MKGEICTFTANDALSKQLISNCIVASISRETLPTMLQEVGLKNFKFIFLSGGSMLKWVAFAACFNSYNAKYFYTLFSVSIKYVADRSVHFFKAPPALKLIHSANRSSELLCLRFID